MIHTSLSSFTWKNNSCKKNDNFNLIHGRAQFIMFTVTLCDVIKFQYPSYLFRLISNLVFEFVTWGSLIFVCVLRVFVCI